MVKGFEGALDYIQHDYDCLTFIPSADYLVVEGTSQGRMSGKSWAGAKLLAVVSATSSSFEMTEYRACTSILIPTIRARTRRGFDGVRNVSGESDDYPSGGFSFKGKGSAGTWHLEPIFVDFETLDFRIERSRGQPDLAEYPAIDKAYPRSSHSR